MNLMIITANDRVHDPGLCGCLRFNDLLLSPKRLVIVAQTSNFVSPKWTFGKIFVAQTSVAQTFCRPNDRTPIRVLLLYVTSRSEAAQNQASIDNPAIAGKAKRYDKK